MSEDDVFLAAAKVGADIIISKGFVHSAMPIAAMRSVLSRTAFHKVKWREALREKGVDELVLTISFDVGEGYWVEAAYLDTRYPTTKQLMQAVIKDIKAYGHNIN